MTGTEPNIEKDINRGEVGHSEVFEAGKIVAAETLSTDHLEDRITPDSIRERIASSGEVATDKVLPEITEKSLAGDEAVSLLTPQQKLEDFIDKGLRAKGFEAFDINDGVNAAVEEEKNSQIQK
ncbi:MAG: hypothetical protein IT410_03390 [Candidatus Doudnabacteria bacterium]|nr:hypothetical protein [Candidatus Doudnabacteria bacterium]